MTAAIRRFGAALSGDPTLGHVLQHAATIRGIACALAFTASVLTLSGCMTAAKETASGTEQTVPETASADPAQAASGTTEDQQVVALGGGAQQAAANPASANSMEPVAADGQPASLTMHSTGLNATSSSIFSVQPQNAAPIRLQSTDQSQGNAPLPVGQATSVAPTSNSLFNSGQPPADTPVLPLEGASNADGTAAATQQVASAGLDAADGATLPAAVPVPASGDTLRAAGDTVQIASTDAAVAVAESGTSENGTDPDDAAQKPLTFAALFAAKRKSKEPFNGDRFATAPAKKPLAVASNQQQQIAALGFTNLPGVRTTSMFATVDDSEPGHDDESPTVEMASLPGLARLAPNGLWLQTEKVETGCFQPELLQVLKVVETHYGRKVMVTSGLRDLKHNQRAGGKRHSLHTTCEAADIQVPGVSKWDLADYLRSIPGRGGVGTYCHTESVHIDTGEMRNWNWRCRRRSI